MQIFLQQSLGRRVVQKLLYNCVYNCTPVDQNCAKVERGADLDLCRVYDNATNRYPFVFVCTRATI